MNKMISSSIQLNFGHSSIGSYLTLIYVLGIINSAAISVNVQLSLWETLSPSAMYPGIVQLEEKQKLGMFFIASLPIDSYQH